MDQTNNYPKQLEEALNNCAVFLEQNALADLQAHIQTFESCVSKIYSTWLEKGIIRKDPYWNERNVNEIQVPSSQEFSEKEADREISLRLSYYVGQWQFLGNIFHLSLSTLTLDNIEKIKELTRWINWSDFSVHSSGLITSTLAGMAETRSRSSGVIAMKLVSDSISTLKNTSTAIINLLAIITTYLQEQYKGKLRKEIISRMNINADLYRQSRTAVLNQVESEVSRMNPPLCWYEELAEKTLKEDFTPGGTELRKNVLQRLEETESLWKKEEAPEPDTTAMLLPIALQISRIEDSVKAALTGIKENSRLMQERQKNLKEILSDFFSRLFHNKSNILVYEIPMKDLRTGFVRYEPLEFQRFISRTMQITDTLQELADPETLLPEGERQKQAESLEKHMWDVLSELRYIHKRLEGLDVYFHSDAVPEALRDRMKSCTMSTGHIKSSISESLKALNLYKSRKEAREQMAKFGIRK